MSSSVGSSVFQDLPCQRSSTFEYEEIQTGYWKFKIGGFDAMCCERLPHDKGVNRVCVNVWLLAPPFNIASTRPPSTFLISMVACRTCPPILCWPNPRPVDLWSTYFRSNGRFLHRAISSSVVPYAGSISLENVKKDLGPFGDEQIDRVSWPPYKCKFNLDCGRLVKFSSGWESNDILLVSSALRWISAFFWILPTRMFCFAVPPTGG
ncbi:uncharacterized protein LACBIDRAFT_324733 [Laccaria bicolor S238N-H82]|uniref:Predicted protein n=1 Tax=Laccaria bicolor (strain S238N-H82 / ATCC MYA-4686) TaxID=486041 RepID=B0D2V7_LACBS|nr:uncharacterized protein LACBIDRAFT_324733 [Laccaria bicolor S238N-H82]EDR11161.1 predicted protein [Laccaria bicolor S238N-H82]|eukprot:XP_001878462.1 predicted protein [Laccaria bicolor S238N-H82]